MKKETKTIVRPMSPVNIKKEINDLMDEGWYVVLVQRYSMGDVEMVEVTLERRIWDEE